MSDCAHLRNPTGTTETPYGVVSEYECAHAEIGTTTPARCLRCVQYLRKGWKPPGIEAPRHALGIVCDRWGRDAGLGDLYLGAPGFLVLGGPSSQGLDLTLLAQRGICIVSVNNCAAVLPAPLRPHIWLHTDPTGKFHDSIWRDPSVLKLSPQPLWKKEGRADKKHGIRRRDLNGKLEIVPGVAAKQMPAVLGFKRNHTFDPEHWLTEPSINNGNCKKEAEKNGWPHVNNTMFSALRLCYYLGFSPLYLLGADFKMEPERPYGFEQGKGAGGIQGNNSAYAKMCVMLDALKPHFDAAGFRVVNLSPGSCLWTFDRMEYTEAVERTTADFEQTLNTEGWYDD